MKFDIEKIAELSRLRLAPEEKEKLEKDLEAILGYVGSLEAVDTANVSATSHVLDLENVFRPDASETSGVRDEALCHAPSKQGHFFKVPKTVEKE